MRRLVVVENTARFPFELEGADVVPARVYLSDPAYAELRNATVFNVCRRYGYQSVGYYVSLLAAARGHRPLPSVETLQDLRLAPVVRLLAEDLEEHVQRVLGSLRSPRFELSVYFGRNLAQRYDRLAGALFDQFPAPFLRAIFVREDVWKLQAIRLIATSDIPESHHAFVMEQAQRYFARPRRSRSRKSYRYDLAILFDPEELDAPSDEGAIRRFIRAARELGIDAERIEPEDHHLIAEFDALFLRQTTSVDHPTYRLARRAAAQGLVVIDDPESIARCTNKVFQAEIFARHGIASPETLVVHERNADEVGARLGYPCVLKRPDSSFSQGVHKVADEKALRAALEAIFRDSELAVAQRFVPSGFDWRIGIIGGRPLWACKYHMARGHWQIIKSGEGAQRSYGRVEACPVDDAPPAVVKLAVRSAALMGDGLYGVDIKDLDGGPLVMEVNDNPTIESGEEDHVLGPELYLAIMRHFRDRLDARGAREAAR